MLVFSDYAMLFFLGAVGAFVAGLLGVGGGIIYIPILDYFLTKLGLTDGNLVKAILANSLFVIIFSGSVASYKQYKIGNFYPKEIVFTALPGLVSVLLMTLIIKYGNWYSKEVFNIVFLAMLFLIVARLLLVKNTTSMKDNKTLLSPWECGITGFFTGFITALSGLGGGVVMTPIFTDVLKVPIKKASSIANGVIPLFALLVGIVNVWASAPVFMKGQLGYVFLPLVAPMIVASFVFAPMGVKYAQVVPARVLRLVFAFFVAIVFLKLLYEMVK
jgi:uncharacterized protein